MTQRTRMYAPNATSPEKPPRRIAPSCLPASAAQLIPSSAGALTESARQHLLGELGKQEHSLCDLLLSDENQTYCECKFSAWTAAKSTIFTEFPSFRNRRSECSTLS